MEINLAHALSSVRVALADTAQRSANRRLAIYGDKVPCKSGCNGCCARLTYVTVAEGVLMYEHLLASGEWPAVRELARQQFRWTQDADPLAWFKMNIKCPVLSRKDGTCLAYSVRPAKCAVHFVTSSPSACDPWNEEGGKYKSADMGDLFTEFSERVKSAVDGHGVMGITASIPAALLLAERISVQSNLTLPAAISLLYNEFSPR